MKKNHSFTLVELLIVVVIIGIITALAIPQYERIKGRSEEAEALRVLRAFSDAIWNYRIEAGDFPPPPGNPPIIPPGLGMIGINIPESKVFDYYYRHEILEMGWLNPYGVVYAMRKDWGSNPINEPDVYYMGFSKTRLSDEEMANNDMKFQKMDNEWYQYYWKLRVSPL